MSEIYARFEYVCPNGHAIGADRPYSQCPVAGCRSTDLIRIGRGSRTRTKEPARA